ncbi:MAG: ATP-binding cassette domain-containing protein [Deltaproteobacteria bacterium]|nr:ATP-binding cassette domain-containing protein [Deltaproteobacteria bacterium]
MSSTQQIELVDVRLDHPRGGPPLVSGANLAVASGEVVVIAGAAGVGTSRLVAAALGELAVSSGRIDVLGRNVGRLRRSSLRLLRRRVGIVPQDLCLLEDRSAQLNVVLPLEIDGIPRSISVQRAADVLALLALTSEAALSVDHLPASARQRVAVARALVRDPDIVLADHPTSAQDRAGTELVCGALARAAERGAGCLVLTRDPALFAIAEARGWRKFRLAAGALEPIATFADLALPPPERSEPVAPPVVAADTADADDDADDAVVANVLPFPISARTAGATR